MNRFVGVLIVELLYCVLFNESNECSLSIIS